MNGTDAEPWALPLYCVRCDGLVTVQVVGWAPDHTAHPSSWPCPYCRGQNRLSTYGALVWVTKGHGDPMLQ